MLSERIHIVSDLKKRDIENGIANSYATYVINLKCKERKIKIGRTKWRDSDRNKLYKAEYLFSQSLCPSKKIHFSNVEEAQCFANDVLRSDSYLENMTMRGASKVTVEYNPNLRRFGGLAYHDKIELAPSGMNNLVLLHELAHTAGQRHHDFGFRAVHLALVAEHIGKEESKLLKQFYKDAGLKLRANSVKIKEFDEWLKIYEKMERARASRSC